MAFSTPPVARLARRILPALLLAAAPMAVAQEDPDVDPPGARPADPPARPPEPKRGDEYTPPAVTSAQTVSINFDDADLYSLIQYFARAANKNFVITDPREFQGKKVTLIANRPVPVRAAYEAFLTTLEVHGYTTVEVGGVHKIIKAQDAQQSPGPILEGGDIAATDNYITQIFQFENVSVTDVRTIVDTLISPNAKVLAYAPTNSLILTDSGHNLRRIYKLISELDIAAPRSRLAIYPIVFAAAEDIKNLIEELYGVSEDGAESQQQQSGAQGRLAARRRALAARRARQSGADAAPEGITAGKESRFIQKVLSDERTNAMIVLANDNGHDAVKDLIQKLDIDVDPTSRSQIYVYRLEHAKAVDVAGVLTDLSQQSSSAGGQGQQRGPQGQQGRVAATRLQSRGAEAANTGEGATGAVAVFDSGLRIAPDENTNALVVIASKDDYAVIESVIKQLDQQRRQVFVEAVVLELTSTDSFDVRLGYHAPIPGNEDTMGFLGGQIGRNSLGFSASPSDLAGLTVGVFSKQVEVPVLNPSTGSTSNITIPAFGIAMQALRTNQMVNIVSTPSILALDNEEAEIVVGRKIPFPTSNAFNAMGQPVISFQREDVAITLKVTPRINSENRVTMEIEVEVQDVEETDGIDVMQGGFITSRRAITTTASVADNQTVALGGLVSSTDSRNDTKVPILGDLPLIGALFRSRSSQTRRTNLVVYMTPHIIDDDADFEEIARVKEAQQAEYLRRFYGRSQEAQMAELRRLLQYSMNIIDQPSVFRGPATVTASTRLDGDPISTDAREELREESTRARRDTPGSRAGRLSDDPAQIFVPAEPAAPGAGQQGAAGDAAPAGDEGADAIPAGGAAPDGAPPDTFPEED